MHSATSQEPSSSTPTPTAPPNTAGNSDSTSSFYQQLHGMARYRAAAAVADLADKHDGFQLQHQVKRRMNQWFIEQTNGLS